MENNQTELRDLRHVDILERPPKILSLRGRDLAAPKKFTREILRSHETDKKRRFILGSDNLFGHRPRSEQYMVNNKGGNKLLLPPHRQAVNKEPGPNGPAKR